MSTVQFPFATTATGWSFVDGGGAFPFLCGWDGTTGQPAGSLKVYSNNFASGTGTANGYVEFTLTWTDFGISPSATITQIVFSVDELFTQTVSGSYTVGPYYLYDSSNATQLYTLLSSRTVTASDSSYVTRTNTVAVSSTGSDTFTIRILGAIGKNVQVNLDNITFALNDAGTPTSANRTLYIRGFDYGNNNATMYITGGTDATGSIDLFASGTDSGCVCAGAEAPADTEMFDSFCLCSPPVSMMDMFISGFSPATGGGCNCLGSEEIFDTDEFDGYCSCGSVRVANLFISGIPDSIFGSIPLYMENGTKINRSLPMTVRGDWVESPSDGLDMFIAGVPYSTMVGRNNLYIKGSSGVNITNSLQLFIHGSVPTKIFDNRNMFVRGSAVPATISAIKPFFMDGEINSGHIHYLNMYLEARPRHQTFYASTLTLAGSHGNGYFTDRPLFIEGGSYGTAFNLYTKGVDSGGTSQLFNLWIEGVANNRFSPLFIRNDQSKAEDFSWMYIGGQGFNVNNPGTNTNINMYIERGPNNGVFLFIKNNLNAYTHPLFIHGLAPTNNNVSLFTNGFLTSGSPTLFVGGKVAQAINNNAKLVIPSTHEIDKVVNRLYIHGFNYN